MSARTAGGYSAPCTRRACGLNLFRVTDAPERQVLEPEVLPPEKRAFPRPKAGKSRRAVRVVGPLLAGVMIDAIDFLTMGLPGLAIGALATLWICSAYRLPLYRRLLYAMAAGLYCALPFRRVVPVATLIGAYIQFSGRDPRA
jgi:hypothetical protein